MRVPGSRIRETRDDGPPEAWWSEAARRRETLRASLVRCEQRLHLAAQPGIVTTLARKKRVALDTGCRHSGVKDREHVLPAFGDHSR